MNKQRLLDETSRNIYISKCPTVEAVIFTLLSIVHGALYQLISLLTATCKTQLEQNRGTHNSHTGNVISLSKESSAETWHYCLNLYELRSIIGILCFLLSVFQWYTVDVMNIQTDINVFVAIPQVHYSAVSIKGRIMVLKSLTKRSVCRDVKQHL